MFTSAYLLFVLAQPLPEASLNEIRVTPSPTSLDLQWSDTEERLQGTIRPTTPRAEAPFEMSLHVGSFQGAEFDGPINVTMRGPEGRTASAVLTRGKDDKAWVTKFTPEVGGDHQLDISFRTTRLKALKAKFEVEDARIGRLPWLFVLGVVVVAALALGVRQALRRT